MRPKSSAVWRYFDEQSEDKVVCRICGRVVPRKAKSTTNLRSHIKHRHPVDFEDLFVIETKKKNLATVSPANVETSTSKIPRKQVTKWPKDVNTSSNEDSTSSSNYYEVLAAKVLKDVDSDEDLPLKRRALRESSIDTRHVEAGNNNEQDSLFIPADGIKRRTSSDIADEDATERDQDVGKDDVWNFFEKIPSNRAQCILCKETFNRHAPFLTKHLNEKHRKVALDLPSDSDDDQNCYTEVVYLEEEQPIKVATKPKTIKQLPEPKKRRPSYRYELVNKTKDDETSSKNEGDEEIENFGRYVIGLLKKMPKEVSTQLQMDIISMIMKAKLRIETPTTENVNLSMSTVQIVTTNDNNMVTTPGNVIVTTPSNVIHTTQNNESIPTLVIGVQNES